MRSFFRPTNGICGLYSLAILLSVSSSQRGMTQPPSQFQKELIQYKESLLGNSQIPIQKKISMVRSISENIVRPDIPYHLRVKFSILLARVCRKFNEMQVQCQIVSSQLREIPNSMSNNLVLASYIENIGLSVPKISPPRSLADNSPSRNTEGKFESANYDAALKEFNDKHSNPVWIFLAATVGLLLLIAGYGEMAKNLRLKSHQSNSPTKSALVVDDDLLSLTLAKKVLSAIGYDVEIYQSPVLALERSRKKSFDLMVLDYFMPEMNGDELAAAIDRDIDPSQHPRLVFLTGKVGQVTPQSGRAHSVKYCGTVAKSFHPQELAREILHATS